MDNNGVIKKRLLRLTPLFAIAISLLALMVYEGVIERGGPDGWKYSLLGKFVKLLLVVIAFDVLLKLVFKQKLIWLWITESLVCLGFVYYWVIS